MGFLNGILFRKKPNLENQGLEQGFWEKKDLIKNLGSKKYVQKHQVIQDPSKAVNVLRGGGLVILPTETLYGLAVRYQDENALERLFRLKGRSLGKQIPLLIEDPKNIVPHLVEEIPEVAQKLMDVFWPGPLTLIFKARKGVPRLIGGKSRTVGLRQSAHPVVRAIVTALGEPITGTSANLSGLPSPFNLEQISPSLLMASDLVIDGDRLKGRKGSTVLDFTGKEIKIIRQGDLPLSRIREHIQL